MVCKKNEPVSEESDLALLIEYVTELQTYVLTLSLQEQINCCKVILQCLAVLNTSIGPVVVEDLLPLEKLIQNISTSLSDERREKFIFDLLNSFLPIVADPHDEASPATFVVLSAIRNDPVTKIAALKCFASLIENEDHVSSLKTALYTMYKWLTNWAYSSYLTQTLLGFINLLEEIRYFDVLIDTSLLAIDGMLNRLAEPISPITQQLAPIFLRILASMRNMPDIMTKISKNMCEVLKSLTNDSNQWAREILQDTVDVVSFIIEEQMRPLDSTQQDVFKIQHAAIIACLERYMPSSSNKLNDIVPWQNTIKTVNVISTPTVTEECRKVGLINLGNTCYFNSTIQALLLTRQFSNHSIRQMCSVPFWSKMSILFAKLNYSILNKINPKDLFNLVKPPYFNRCQQQDSRFVADPQDEDHVSSLKTALYTIYKWLTNWAYSSYLTQTLLGFIKLLEIARLERYMPSSSNKLNDIVPWQNTVKTVNVISTPTVTEECRKVGLINLGNTCYFNSTIQALLLTRQFSNHSIRQMCSVPFWSKMSILFAKLNYSILNKINPKDFFNLVKPPYFNRHQQQDSSEFLVYLLNLLEQVENSKEDPKIVKRRTSTSSTESANSDSSSSSSSPKSSGSKSSSLPCNKRSALSNGDGPPKKRFCSGPSTSSSPWISYIQTTFGGSMLTETKCNYCNTSSQNRDLFRDLQLGFPEEAEKKQHSVQSLLEYYCSPELLTGDNSYQCPNCNVLRDAQRSVVIDLAPNHLIITLKRFKYDPRLQLLTKLMHTVYHDHRIYLPTGSRQLERTAYDLYATVIHSGTTLNSGHYYTIGKDNGQWYLFNDEVVKPCTEDDLNSFERSCTPYMLFYRKADIEEEATVPQEELCSRITECMH